MRAETKVALISCDNTDCTGGPNGGQSSDLEERTGKWFKLVQARSDLAVGASLSHLDFCSSRCVETFVNEDVYVQQRNGVQLLAGSGTESLGVIEFLRAYRHV